MRSPRSFSSDVAIGADVSIYVLDWGRLRTSLIFVFVSRLLLLCHHLCCNSIVTGDGKNMVGRIMVVVGVRVVVTKSWVSVLQAFARRRNLHPSANDRVCWSGQRRTFFRTHVSRDQS